MQVVSVDPLGGMGGQATLVAAENTGSQRGAYDKVWNCIGQAKYNWDVRDYGEGKKTIIMRREATQGSISFENCYPSTPDVKDKLPSLRQQAPMMGTYEAGLDQFSLEDTLRCSRIEMKRQPAARRSGHSDNSPTRRAGCNSPSTSGVLSTSGVMSGTKSDTGKATTMTNAAVRVAKLHELLQVAFLFLSGCVAVGTLSFASLFE